MHKVQDLSCLYFHLFFYISCIIIIIMYIAYRHMYMQLASVLIETQSKPNSWVLNVNKQNT